MLLEILARLLDVAVGANGLADEAPSVQDLREIPSSPPHLRLPSYSNLLIASLLFSGNRSRPLNGQGPAGRREGRG
jgi:hypothetical protein